MKDNTLPEEIIRRAIELIDKEETNDFEYEHELAIVKLALQWAIGIDGYDDMPQSISEIRDILKEAEEYDD